MLKKVISRCKQIFMIRVKWFRRKSLFCKVYILNVFQVNIYVGCFFSSLIDIFFHGFDGHFITLLDIILFLFWWTTFFHDCLFYHASLFHLFLQRFEAWKDAVIDSFWIAMLQCSFTCLFFWIGIDKNLSARLFILAQFPRSNKILWQILEIFSSNKK